MCFLIVFDDFLMQIVNTCFFYYYYFPDTFFSIFDTIFDDFLTRFFKKYFHDIFRREVDGLGLAVKLVLEFRKLLEASRLLSLILMDLSIIVEPFW